jgi:Spy/CpxP family protein refolding chaperone
MNKSLRWKLILAFLLVFVAGVACGFFGAVHMHQAFFAHMAPDSMAQHMKQRLRVELRLTPDQMQQISPIVDRAGGQLKTTREQTMRSVHEIFIQMHREIQPFLTPEQRGKLEDMEKRHRRLLHRHGFMPPGPPPPSPDDRS